MSKRCPGNRSGVMRFNAQALLYPMRVSRCFQTRRVFLACADFSLFGQMSLARQVMTLTISSNCLKRIVAVGTGIAPRPPHGPGRARLTHPVLIAGKMRTDRGSHEHPL